MRQLEAIDGNENAVTIGDRLFVDIERLIEAMQPFILLMSEGAKLGGDENDLNYAEGAVSVLNSLCTTRDTMLLEADIVRECK